MSKQSVIKDLLELIGSEGRGNALSPEEVNDILQNGVKHALKAQLDVIVSSDNDKTKAFVAKDWLDRAGYKPADKVIAKNIIAFDPETLRVLALIAAESEDDQDSGVRTFVGEIIEDGSGRDQGALEAEITEVSLLSEQSSAGIQGSQPDVPQEAGVGDSGPDGKKEVAGGEPGASEDDPGNDSESNLPVDPTV